jgi:hypothetical protein
VEDRKNRDTVPSNSIKDAVAIYDPLANLVQSQLGRDATHQRKRRKIARPAGDRHPFRPLIAQTPIAVSSSVALASPRSFRAHNFLAARTLPESHGPNSHFNCGWQRGILQTPGSSRKLGANLTHHLMLLQSIIRHNRN